MEAGTLVEWLVKPGDRVKRGDIVAVVETQKGAIEIETFQPGQIEKFLVDLNSKVPVGTPLAQIRTEGEAKPAAVAPRRRRAACRAAARGAGRCACHAPGGDACSRAIAAARCPACRGRELARRRLRDGLPKSAASIFRRSPAAARVARSPTPTSSAVSARPPPRRKRSARPGSISTPCERPSPPPWRDRSGKSRTIISSIRSTSRLASNG